jgi:Xaa-Pro aminopeptidase
MHELTRKLATVREALRQSGLAGARFRGTDWFAWATCGGSNVVLLTTDVGIAELLVTERDACVLTDEIEAGRLRAEELPSALEVASCRWTERPAAWDAQVRERAGGRVVASDRPGAGEAALPQPLVAARSSLLPEELERYRGLGRAAAEAMSEVLLAAKPSWTERQLAGAGAEALWARGIEPALTLAAGERRLPIYRHATPTSEKLGGRAMLVFCGRRHGLFANLTRFVYFRAPAQDERAADGAVAEVEGAGLETLRPGATLGAVYGALVEAYARAGFAGQERAHHQGGTCGYSSRDVVALPGSTVRIAPDNAVAFNPSLPGAKIEDTVVVREAGIEVLTVDARWPTRTVRGRTRPSILVR